MKKAMLAFLMTFGFMMAFWTGGSMSQDRRVRAIFNPETGITVVALEEEPTVEQRRLLELRTEYLNLMKGLVESMTDKELSEGIAHLKSMQKEAEAKKKLNRAIGLLAEIIREYPDSNVGRRARIMLRFATGNTEEGGATEDAGSDGGDETDADPSDPADDEPGGEEASVGSGAALRLATAEERLRHTERLHKRGFVNKLQLEADRFAVAKAIKELQLAKGDQNDEKTILEIEFLKAEHDLSVAMGKLQFTERLLQKGYITESQFKADKLAVDKARGRLESAKAKLKAHGQSLKDADSETRD